MVQYKHKKTGIKVIRFYSKPGQYDFYQQVNNKEVMIPASIIETGNDWEGVVETFKILSLKHVGGAIWNRQSDGRYKADSWIDNVAGEYDLSWIYPHRHNSIRSASRNGDGVIFTVGDQISTYGGEFTILGMNIVNDQLVFVLNNPYDRTTSNTVLIQNVRRNLSKPPAPFYKTEDGVEIWNPEKYKQLWGVAVQSTGSDRLRQGYNIGIGEYSIPSSNRKWFYDKQNAEMYLIYNTPCLSINDISTVYVTAGIKKKEPMSKKYKQPQKLLELAKTKLGINGEQKNY